MRLVLAIALGLLFPAAAAAEQADSRDCFLSSNWRGWSAVDEGQTLYLRMNNGDIFRVELSPGSRARRAPGEFLVSQVRGSSRICSAIDLDLALSDDNGFSRPLIPIDLRKLTPEEAAAIAPEDRPY